MYPEDHHVEQERHAYASDPSRRYLR